MVWWLFVCLVDCGCMLGCWLWGGWFGEVWCWWRCRASEREKNKLLGFVSPAFCLILRFCLVKRGALWVRSVNHVARYWGSESGGSLCLWYGVNKGHDTSPLRRSLVLGIEGIVFLLYFYLDYGMDRLVIVIVFAVNLGYVLWFVVLESGFLEVTLIYCELDSSFVFMISTVLMSYHKFCAKLHVFGMVITITIITRIHDTRSDVIYHDLPSPWF